MKKFLVGSLIVLFIAVVALTGITLFSRIDSISITGNGYYTEQQLREFIFCDEDSYIPTALFWRELTDSGPEIPFVESYSISFLSLTEVQVTVTPEVPVGYVEFTDCYLYFDRDGMVVESTDELYPDVPRVTGLDIEYMVLGRELPVSSRTILNKLVQVSQFLSSRSVEWNGEEKTLINVVDRIHFDNNRVSLYMDDIEVNFGSVSELEGSLAEFADIIPKLNGMSGTLHMETYDSTKEAQEFRFY